MRERVREFLKNNRTIILQFLRDVIANNTQNDMLKKIFLNHYGIDAYLYEAIRTGTLSEFRTPILTVEREMCVSDLADNLDGVKINGESLASLLLSVVRATLKTYKEFEKTVEALDNHKYDGLDTHGNFKADTLRVESSAANSQSHFEDHYAAKKDGGTGRRLLRQREYHVGRRTDHQQQQEEEKEEKECCGTGGLCREGECKIDGEKADADGGVKRDCAPSRLKQFKSAIEQVLESVVGRSPVPVSSDDDDEYDDDDDEYDDDECETKLLAYRKLGSFDHDASPSKRQRTE